MIVLFISGAFYKMKITCEGFVVDCIVDRRIEEPCLKNIKNFEGMQMISL